MEQIIKLIILSVLFIVSIIVYFILMGTVLPKILRVRCSFKESLDRGLKKYTYPSGRGIVYEPHPSIRKYVHHYALFTNDGYKYIKCNLDESVRQLKYTVVMFDHRKKVIDVLDVEEKNISSGETAEVLIHQDTSYVAFVLDSVNGERLKHKSILVCKIWFLLAYALSVAAVSFVGMIVIRKALLLYGVRWFRAEMIRIPNMIAPSVLIGVLIGALVFRHFRKKEIQWIK